MDRKERRGYKIFKTVMMNFSPIALGIFLEIVGPTLPDLKRKLGVNYEEIARGLVARSVGYFISSASGGVLADLLPRHLGLLLAMALGLAGLSTGLVPFASRLWLLGLFFHMQGLAQGFIDTFNNSLCTKMWGKKATVPLHGLHLGFGIGAFIAPQIARPFISDRKENIDSDAPTSMNNDTSVYMVTSHWLNTTAMHDPDFDERPSKVGMPYFISCAISTFFALVFLLFYVYERMNQISFNEEDITHVDRTEEESIKLNTNQDEMHSNTNEEDLSCSKTQDDIEKVTAVEIKSKGIQNYIDIFSPGTCTNGNKLFGVQFFCLIFLYYINIVGGERVYGKFIYSYALDSKSGFDRDSATLVNSLFWIFFTIGRALAVVLSKFVKARNLIFINLICNVFCGVILSIWGYEKAMVLYIATSVLGLTLSPLFPNCMAWANAHVKLTGVAIALIFTGGACGGAIYQWLGGYFYEYYGSETMMYTMLISSMALSSVFGLLLLTVKLRR